jgi:predicted nuclease of restriction endonuclease-like (RecB) superfamily
MQIDIVYKNWISELKLKVRSAQIKAAMAVNKELILFYWDFGNMLSEKIQSSNWGDKVLENVSKDLKKEFPEMKGFSKTNLKYIKMFYEYFSSNFEISHPIGDQLSGADFQSTINDLQGRANIPDIKKSPSW